MGRESYWFAMPNLMRYHSVYNFVFYVRRINRIYEIARTNYNNAPVAIFQLIRPVFECKSLYFCSDYGQILHDHIYVLNTGKRVITH